MIVLYVVLYLCAGVLFWTITNDALEMWWASPIRKIFAPLLWPVTMVFVIFFGVYYIVRDWVKEVRDYYSNDEED